MPRARDDADKIKARVLIRADELGGSMNAGSLDQAAKEIAVDWEWRVILALDSRAIFMLGPRLDGS